MLAFWRLGYEFGNKEELFRKTLQRYAEGLSSYEREALARPTAREVAEALLRGAADLQTQPDLPHGCLAVLSAPSNAAESSIGQALIAARGRRRRCIEAAARQRGD
jgi:AcrR family transcriptional regulator